MIMDKVAKWQIAHPSIQHEHGELDWTQSAFYIGLFKYGDIRLTKEQDSTYINYLYQIGYKYHWQPSCRFYNADDLAICQLYLQLYKLFHDDFILTPSLARIDWIVNHPSNSSLYLSESDDTSKERWSWCDALFMAPPVFADLFIITKNRKYLNFMYSEYSATYELLYDKSENLFIRDWRYRNKRERNGCKVFWGRGNAWVLAGLANVLDALPTDDCLYRRFTNLYIEMAEKVSMLQDKRGFWHASLEDPDSYPNPEMSATAFFTYALAFGINKGILSSGKYKPIVYKAWNAITDAISEDGKVGWVQPIGADPHLTTKDMTEVYGAGAVLMAGSELYKLCK